VSDLLWGIIGTLIGTIIGSLSSFFATYYATKSNLKSTEKMENNKIQHEINMDNRQRRIDLYVDLSRIIGKMEIPTFISDNDHLEVNVDEFSKIVKIFGDYCNNKEGEMQLFLSSQLYSDIINFRADLYSLTQMKGVLLRSDCKDRDENPFFITINESQRLIYMFKTDLGINAKKSMGAPFSVNQIN